MSKTVSKLGDLHVVEIPTERAEECLRWIHSDLPSSELKPLLDEVVRRPPSGLLSLEARCDDQTVAAGYFRLLAGNVATLGGVRGITGLEPAMIDMIVELGGRLERRGIRQIQAVVHSADAATAQIVEKAGFEQLTSIGHLWLDLCRNGSRGEGNVVSNDSCNDSSVTWRPAATVVKSELASLIDATFAETLDCPALNAVRGKAEVLEGFLEGRELPSVESWEVLQLHGSHAGCVLLTKHPDQVMELTYMGLVPSARGKKLGRRLVRRAIDLSQSLGAHVLVAAVDENNWPALKIYQELGFQHHQKFSVWLRPGG